MPLANLDRLDQMLSKNVINHEDFLKAFGKVLNFVIRIQKEQQEAITNLEQRYIQIFSQLNSKHEDNFKTLKGQVNELFVGDQLKRMKSNTEMNFGKLKGAINRIINEKIGQIDSKLASVKDGYTPVKGKDYFDGKDVDMEKMMEMMKENLTIDSVKDLRNILKRIASMKPMGRARVEFTDWIDVSSQCNGQQKTFNLGRRDVRGIKSVIGTQFPRIFNSSGDWTLRGEQVILGDSIAAPAAGQTLIIIADVLFAS